jgi:hypothetical protein
MVKIFTNINKANNYLSTQTTEGKTKNTIYGVENSGLCFGVKSVYGILILHLLITEPPMTIQI